jgi:transposase
MSPVLWSEAMRRPRRNHSSEFKAKVALAAIQGDLTMSELVKNFNIHANQITEWKKQLSSGAPDVFGKGAQKAENAEQTASELHAKIGQLTRACPMSGASALGMENDFLERGLTRIHGPRGKKW